MAGPPPPPPPELRPDGSGDNPIRSYDAAWDYQRILELVERLEGCVETVRDALPDRTLDGNLTARNYSAQIETDALELQALLLGRHRAIQKARRAAS